MKARPTKNFPPRPFLGHPTECTSGFYFLRLPLDHMYSAPGRPGTCCASQARGWQLQPADPCHLLTSVRSTSPGDNAAPRFDTSSYYELTYNYHPILSSNATQGEDFSAAAHKSISSESSRSPAIQPSELKRKPQSCPTNLRYRFAHDGSLLREHAAARPYPFFRMTSTSDCTALHLLCSSRRNSKSSTN